MSDAPERPRAVALLYEGGGAPTVVAKGEDELARHIIEEACRPGVAIEENAALAEALSHVAQDMKPSAEQAGGFNPILKRSRLRLAGAARRREVS